MSKNQSTCLSFSLRFLMDLGFHVEVTIALLSAVKWWLRHAFPPATPAPTLPPGPAVGGEVPDSCPDMRRHGTLPRHRSRSFHRLSSHNHLSPLPFPPSTAVRLLGIGHILRAHARAQPHPRRQNVFLTAPPPLLVRCATQVRENPGRSGVAKGTFRRSSKASLRRIGLRWAAFGEPRAFCAGGS